MIAKVTLKCIYHLVALTAKLNFSAKFASGYCSHHHLKSLNFSEIQRSGVATSLLDTSSNKVEYKVFLLAL